MSSSDSSDNEDKVAVFERSLEFKIANGADHYLMIGTQEERTKDEGGQAGKLGAAGVVTASFTASKKESTIFSGIRWQTADFHSLTTITFLNDSFRNKPALVYIWHPERGMPEQKYAQCGETIIVTRAGTLKSAISKAIKPKGTDGQEISKKRKNFEGSYHDLILQAERERHWIPKDDPTARSIDPHVQRRIKDEDCEMCNVNYSGNVDPSINRDRIQAVDALRDRIMGANPPLAITDTNSNTQPIVEEVE